MQIFIFHQLLTVWRARSHLAATLAAARGRGGGCGRAQCRKQNKILINPRNLTSYTSLKRHDSAGFAPPHVTGETWLLLALLLSASPASIEAPGAPPSRRRGRGARIWTRGPPSTATPPLLVAFATFRPTRRKSNEGDGAVRAAARLNSAGCRAFRSSVEARHRGFAAGRRVRL